MTEGQDMGVDTTTAEERLLAIRFDHPLKSQECLIAMARLASGGSFGLEDAAIVYNTDGKIRLQQTRDMTAAQGAGSGGWIGAVVGILGGPLGMVAGGALGAAVGGLWARLRDIGIDDDHMRAMGESLEEGESALFLLLKDYFIGHLTMELRRFDGRLLESTLDDSDTEAVRDALHHPI